MSTTGAWRVGRLAAVAALCWGTLAACAGGGTPPDPPDPDACHGGSDVEAFEGAELNGTIPGVETELGVIAACNDHTSAPDPTTGVTDTDVFDSPELTAVGRIQVDCPSPDTLHEVRVGLLTATGTLLGLLDCTAVGDHFTIAVGPGLYYLRVAQHSNNVEALVTVGHTTITDPASDPPSAAVPAIRSGTVSASDTTDTLTFTTDGSTLRIRRGCLPGITYDITGTSGGSPVTFANLACGPGASESTVTFQAGTVTIVVKAPSTPTQVYPYTFELSYLS